MMLPAQVHLSHLTFGGGGLLGRVKASLLLTIRLHILHTNSKKICDFYEGGRGRWWIQAVRLV